MVWQPNGQLLGIDKPTLVAVHHRNGTSPIPLSGNQPVVQFVVHLSFHLIKLRQLLLVQTRWMLSKLQIDAVELHECIVSFVVSRQPKAEILAVVDVAAHVDWKFTGLSEHTKSERALKFLAFLKVLDVFQVYVLKFEVTDDLNGRTKLCETIERELPEFAKMVAEAPVDRLVLHQDAFAAGYNVKEYILCGMALKYAGLHWKDVRIIGTPGETV